MRIIFRWILLIAVMDSGLLSGCATHHSAAVVAQPVTCAVHYRDLTRKWIATEYQCAESNLPFAAPRIRNLTDSSVDTQTNLAGEHHGAH